MSVKLSDAQQKLLHEKNFASLGTINRDGSLQITPVWVDYDGSDVLINTEEKRLKTRNMKRDGRVSVSVLDMSNPYQYLEIRGRVTKITTDGASDEIDRFAKKYLGQDKYPYHQPGDVRVSVRIEPERLSGNIG